MYDIRRDEQTGKITRIDGLPDGMHEKLAEQRCIELAKRLQEEKDAAVFQKPTNDIVPIV
jgi:hypothetical protein